MPLSPIFSLLASLAAHAQHCLIYIKRCLPLTQGCIFSNVNTT